MFLGDGAGLCVQQRGLCTCSLSFCGVEAYCNTTALWLSLFCSDGEFLYLSQVHCLARPTKQQSCPEISWARCRRAKSPSSLKGLWVNVMKAVQEGCAEGQLLVVLISACHTYRVKGFCESIQSTPKQGRNSLCHTPP